MSPKTLGEGNEATSPLKKSVANVQRNASKKNPEFVLQLCRKWATLKDPNTNWIIKDGLRKLKESQPKIANEILNSIGE